jgi:hypothetical protein
MDNAELDLTGASFTAFFLAELFSTELWVAELSVAAGACCKLSVTTISLINDPIYFLKRVFFDPALHCHQHINILSTVGNLYINEA